MIITDFSQLCIANIVQFPEDFAKGQCEPTKAVNLVRHSTLSTLLSYKRQYGTTYGPLVIATDGDSYWRRDEFEFYKASRKTMRAESDLDWQVIHDAVNLFKQEFMEIFPYPVIRVSKAEADDVIAVLCEWSQTNDLSESLLDDGDPQKVLILSSDHDFKQLHKYKNVRQWSPLLKKYVEASRDGIHFDLIEKIVKGDKGDGVPNLYMPDDHFVNGTTRQKSVMAPRLAEFVAFGEAACANDVERHGYHRNKRLVDLSQIPQSVKDSILADYLSKKDQKVDRQKILAYFNKHRIRQLVDNIQEF